MYAMATSRLAALVTLLVYSFHHVTAGGTLQFVDLEYYSTGTLPHGDDTYHSVSIDVGLNFGNTDVSFVNISTNGYFSMGGSLPYVTLPNFPLPNSNSVVAPFAADIDTSHGGSVRYTNFSSFQSDLEDVNSFINSQIDGGQFSYSEFYGTEMMVVEWDNVPKDLESSTVTNTFQGILITDGTDTFAVFIYKCGGMEWGGGVIGWQAGPSHYASHKSSGDSDNYNIGCLYSTSYSAVVYKLTLCPTGDFTCHNGNCVYDFDVCDDFDDCGDNSDEHGCFNTPLIIGGSVGGFIILVGIVSCIVITVLCARRRSRIRRYVVTTAPPTTSTTIASVQTHSERTPLLQPVAHSHMAPVGPHYQQNVSYPVGNYGPQQNTPYPVHVAPSYLPPNQASAPPYHA